MIWDIFAGVFSGIIGAMGLGGGAVLLIYLSLIKNIDQLKAQGINLLFFIPVAVFSVIIYAFKKEIKWKPVLLLSVSGLLGAFVGVWISGIVGAKIIGKVFGGLLLIMGAFQVFSAFKTKKEKKSSHAQ